MRRAHRVPAEEPDRGHQPDHRPPGQHRPGWHCLGWHCLGWHRPGRSRRVDLPGHRSHPDPQVLAASLGLTPREGEVLALIAEGLSNLEIAGRLVVSEATVKSHVNHLLAKIGVRGRAQAVSVAYQHGFTPPGPPG
jgi:DNA-binding CsgD family transcriptional regulator